MSSPSPPGEAGYPSSQVTPRGSVISSRDDGSVGEISEPTNAVPPGEDDVAVEGELQSPVPGGSRGKREEHLDGKGIDNAPEVIDTTGADSCSVVEDVKTNAGAENSEMCQPVAIAEASCLEDHDSRTPGTWDSPSKIDAAGSSASACPCDDGNGSEAQDSRVRKPENFGAEAENRVEATGLESELSIPHTDGSVSEKVSRTNQESHSKDSAVESNELTDVGIPGYFPSSEHGVSVQDVPSDVATAVVGLEEPPQKYIYVDGYSQNSNINSKDELKGPVLSFGDCASGSPVIDLGQSLAPTEITNPLYTDFEPTGRGTEKNQDSDSEENQPVDWDMVSLSSEKDHARYYLPQLNESNFSISDLVWGKVKSHPWWPAQIFDPCDASEIALRYKKRDSYLVAYFGDHTFAWNEASHLKPFCFYFTQMEMQSGQSAFLNAINCALDEIARRVEFGLACYCIPDDVYNRIKGQSMQNAGIREGAAVSDTAYGSLNMTALEPDKLIQYVKDLALFPCGGADRLELTIAKAQLLSFYRSKGHAKLPELCMDRVFTDNEHKILTAEGKACNDAIMEVTPTSRKSKDGERSSRKRKTQISDDGFGSSKKQRSLADLMGDQKSPISLSSGKNLKTVQSTSSSGRGRKRKIQLSNDLEQHETPPPAKKSFNVGECISRIASQLTRSSPILRNNDVKSEPGGIMVDRSKDTTPVPFLETSERPERNKSGTKMTYPSPKELLSQLCLAAQDPIKGYSFMSTVVNFFAEYREASCQENSHMMKHNKKKGLGKAGVDKSAMSETIYSEPYKFDDVEDSYWTDRIVHSNGGELPLESELVQVEVEHASTIIFTKSESEDNKPVECSPTALILNFKEADSLPSVSDLKRIFSRYGPVEESATEVLRKSKRAKVVFKYRADAEVAFSSSGKFSTFGPALVSYQLKYLPSPSKVSHDSTMLRTSEATAVQDCTQISQIPAIIRVDMPSPPQKDLAKAQCGEEVPAVACIVQTSELPEKDTIQIGDRVGSCSMNGSSLLSAHEDGERPIECGTEVPSSDGTSKTSLLTLEEVKQLECKFEHFRDEGSKPSEEPANVEMQIETLNGGIVTDGKSPACCLVKTLENRRACGDLCLMEENSSLSEFKAEIEIQTDCTPEYPQIEGQNQTPNLAGKDLLDSSDELTAMKVSKSCSVTRKCVREVEAQFPSADGSGPTSVLSKDSESVTVPVSELLSAKISKRTILGSEVDARQREHGSDLHPAQSPVEGNSELSLLPGKIDAPAGFGDQAPVEIQDGDTVQADNAAS